MNAQCKLGRDLDIEVWLKINVSEDSPADIIFIFELDTQRSSQRKVHLENWVCYRKWKPGQRAMTWLVRKDLVWAVKYRKWIGRSGSLMLEDDQKQLLYLVGTHQAHHEILWQSLSETAKLWRRNRVEPGD